MEKQLDFKTRMYLYFWDLDLYLKPVYGFKSNARVNLWLTACYLFYSLGVYAKQCITINEYIGVRLAGLQWPVLLYCFAAGLALFPFSLRLIIYFVNKIPAMAKQKENEQFNLLHLLVSFGVGFFFNLVYTGVHDLIAKTGIF